VKSARVTAEIAEIAEIVDLEIATADPGWNVLGTLKNNLRSRSFVGVFSEFVTAPSFLNPHIHEAT
jgi:hypothetical protein